ncbi:MAG: efflux RND transporter periplasmic adaptor subunit [Proteobacteria bacterium]|nr:efflux RND transporter periplasmic adaptor subunit [Pseudomonadota bacterium]
MRSKTYFAAGNPAAVEGSSSNNITGQKRRTIRSPVDGVITARMLAAGEFVYEQSPILEIAEINPLFVETFLPIDLYQHVRGKETATVVPAAPVSGRFEAKISVVDQVFDAASGTFGVRLLLDNPDGALPAGVPCRVYFD